MKMIKTQNTEYLYSGEVSRKANKKTLIYQYSHNQSLVIPDQFLSETIPIPNDFAFYPYRE